MFIIYDLIFLFIAIIYLPIYLFRRKFHRGFLSRLGFLAKDLALSSPVWIHAVSVGEAMAIRGLVEELRPIYPDKKFVISTVTPTGNKIARTIAKEGDFVTYLPLDLSFIVRVVLDRISPSLFIIAETEIWPNLISCLYKKKIPIAVVNGRISDASFRGYLAIKFLVKPVFKKIALFCVQTARDGERLMRLGVWEDKIKITGNMKFDNADLRGSNADGADKYKSILGLSKEEKLLVAGSTHPGEEEIILNVYRGLLAELPYLRLLIAPRHPERAAEIEKLVKVRGFNAVRISKLNDSTPASPAGRIQRFNACLPARQDSTIFILDTIGQLLSFYALADIVFVGGSLVRKGGHNILEPASFAKPILFGPHMFNFRDIADLFLASKAAILVHNQEELKTNIKYLLNNNSRISELGRQARELIRQNQGATRRNAEYIRTLS